MSLPILARLLWLITAILLASQAIAQPAPIRSIAEVASLTDEQAAKGLRVDIEATVYFVDPNLQFLFVGQGKDFISLDRWKSPIPLGSKVSIQGITKFDARNKVIQPETVRVIAEPELDANGVPRLAEPILVTPDSMELGDMNSQWVSLEATVELIQLEPKRTSLFCRSGNTRVVVSYPLLQQATEVVPFVDAKIRAIGNLSSQIVDGSAVQFELACPKGFVEILAPADPPFFIPSRQSVDSLWNDNEATEYQLSGQVTFAWPNGFFMETSAAGCFIHVDQNIPATVGSILDVYGRRVVRKDGGGDLYASIISHVGSAVLPEPPLSTVNEIFRDKSPSQRVRIAGKLVKSDRIDDITTISLTSNESNVLAYLSATGVESLDLASAEEITVAGSCAFTTEQGYDLAIFVPLLSDLEITKRKSIFVNPYVATLLTLSLALLVFGGFWACSLRSQIRTKKSDLANMSAQLRLAYDSVRDGIVVIGPDQKIIHANRVAGDILGFELRTGESTKAFQTRIKRHLQVDDFLTHWQRLNDSVTASEELVLNLVLSPGDQHKSLELFTSPVKNQNGEFVGRLWTFHDVTEKEELQRSLFHAQKQEAIGQLAGSFAHDFNNLLMGIHGNLFVAQLDPKKTVEQVDQSLSAAIQASNRAAKLVSALLGFSRKTPLQLRVQDLNRIVKRMLQLLRPALSEDCRIHLSKGLAPVKADDLQLEQVMLNICLNAADAIQDGGKITLSTFAVRKAVGLGPERDFVVISIADSGCGMSAEVRERIFEPFFTTKAGKGTGLGLAMAEGIIHQHGGVIECDSTVGHGTEFRIYLPATREHVNVAQPKTDVFLSRLQGRNILVVDDDQLVLNATSSMLVSLGSKVIVAPNGKTALELLNKQPEIDVVLLDWFMPEMNGNQLLQKIRVSFPDLPVIICSGCIDERADIMRLADMKPDAVLQKPFDAYQIAKHLVPLTPPAKAGPRRSTLARQKPFR